MKGSRQIIALALFAAGGCGPKPMTFLKPPEPPVVWPQSPDIPHVRYIGSLTGGEDIGQAKSFGQVMDELVYGPQPKAKLVSPHAIAVNATGEKVAIADVNGKCVHVFNLKAQTYTPLVQVGASFKVNAEYHRKSPATSPADDGAEHTSTNTLECPIAVCWAGDRLWVADSKLHALAVFEPGGMGRWIGADKLKRPSGMAYNPKNQLCYVADAGTHRLLAFDNKGELVAELGSHGNGPGQFNCPSHIACGPDGTLVVADSLNFRVQQLGPDGSPIAAFGRKGDAAGDLSLPKGVAVDTTGTIWVVDAQFENIQAFTPDGKLLMALGKEGHNPGEFWLPAGICIDNQHRMWVADRENGRVQIFALMP